METGRTIHLTFRALRSIWMVVVLAWAAAGQAAADFPKASTELPPAQAVAVVGKGVVWFDNGTIALQSFVGNNTTLGWISPSEARRRFPHMAASATAVAALLKRPEPDGSLGGATPGFIGGVPPRALVSIPQPRPIRGGGCQRWEPATHAAIGDFVVAADTLVTAAECDGERLISGEVQVIENEAFELQPLFARDLRRGQWRVLRWLPGGAPPILAAEGNQVAIGVQSSLAKMEVSIVDVRSGRTQSHFGAPDGYLSFASPERLVLSVPAFARPWEREFGPFPLRPQMPLLGRSYSEARVAGYSLALYSTRGKRIASIGSSEEPPLVSRMHLLSVQTNEDAQSFRSETSALISARSLISGATTQVIGFNPPGRALITLAFRWPALAIVETTSAARSQSEITCFNSEYQPASSPFLGVFDLAHAEPFLPAPPSPHLVRPAPSTCGPAPPPVHVYVARQRRR